MKIAACCMTKNEERDIIEWALYHAWTGFDAVVVFDNNSEDQTRKRLRSIEKLVDLRVFDWPYDYRPGHFDAFAACVNRYKSEFDWIALFDHDEFFVPVAHDNPKDYLKSMEQHASIAVNWAMYGSSGQLDYPEDLVTRVFTYRAPTSFSANRHAKSIVRPSEMTGCRSSHSMDMKPGIQTVDSKGQPVDWQKRGKMTSVVGIEDTARFNHYFVRSKAHWISRMSLPYNIATRSNDQFELYDRNDVYDPVVVTKYGHILDRINRAKEESARWPLRI